MIRMIPRALALLGLVALVGCSGPGTSLNQVWVDPSYAGGPIEKVLVIGVILDILDILDILVTAVLFAGSRAPATAASALATSAWASVVLKRTHTVPASIRAPSSTGMPVISSKVGAVSSTRVRSTVPTSTSSSSGPAQAPSPRAPSNAMLTLIGLRTTRTLTGHAGYGPVTWKRPSIARDA